MVNNYYKINLKKESRSMLETTKGSRTLYLRFQIITAFIVVIGHWIVVLLNIWKPPKAIPTKVLLYFGVPIVLFFLYFTSVKKIFSQRFGDAVQNCILVLLISTFGFYYGGGIGGDFVFLFLLLIAFSSLLLDPFIPLLTAGLTSSIIVGEFILTIDLTHLSYTLLIKSLLQVMSFFIVGWLSSGFVKKTLAEQKITQKLEKAYRELKKLDEAKSEFISIASHQLRTPLTAIKGYISMIHDRTYGVPPEKMEKPLRHIYISAERLIKLVSELLNISRIEAGKIKTELEISSLEDIINSVITELKSLVKEKDLYLEFKKGKEPLPKISIDKEKMRQVILNIIDNAIRYTKEGGITVRCKKKENTYQVKVSDTGEGMTKREISDLFKSFSRGKAGKKGWVEGAGLGLYIAKKYVDMHKGKIWAKSQGKGKGSSFYIELPIQ